MSYREEATWGQIAVLALAAVVLLFLVARCAAGHKQSCIDSGGTPLSQGSRSTHYWCTYTDGRQPVEFEMR
jgi:hypothetical protein